MEISHKLQNLQLVSLGVSTLRQIIISNQYVYGVMNAIYFQIIAILKQRHMQIQFFQPSQLLNLKQSENGSQNYKHVNIHLLQIRQESGRLKLSLLHIAKNVSSKQIYGFVSLVDIFVVDVKFMMVQEVITLVQNTLNKQVME